jgi:hypothetical protein
MRGEIEVAMPFPRLQELLESVTRALPRDRKHTQLHISRAAASPCDELLQLKSEFFLSAFCYATPFFTIV